MEDWQKEAARYLEDKDNPNTCGDCSRFDHCFAESCSFLDDFSFDDYDRSKKIKACSEFKRRRE